MPHYQTCRRHPFAGRFLAECFGCKRELFDLQERNRAIAAAHAALATIGTTDARIIDATWVSGALVVSTHQPDAYLPYAVDAFRLPTPAETDPELAEWARRTPGQWILVDQHGDYTEDAVPGMTAEATVYLKSLNPLEQLAA